MTGRLSRLYLLLAVVVATATGACISRGAFHCDTSAQCDSADGPGICEPNGACSFGDSTCPSGRRYGELSALASSCVPPSDAGLDAALDAGDATPDAALDAGDATPDAAQDASEVDAETTDADVDAEFPDASTPDAALCGNLAQPCCGATCNGSLRCTSPGDGVCTCFAELEAGRELACVRKTNGSVWCWGQGTSGQLGNMAPAIPGTPVLARMPVAAVGLAPGGSHNCIAGADAHVYCIGSNTLGQLGDGTENDQPLDFVQVRTAAATLSNVQGVATGYFHGCALAGQSVVCWGQNDFDQLGYATPALPTPTRSTVADLVGISNVETLVVGAYHDCAILTDTTLSCWGDNQDYQLGRGMTTMNSLIPMRAGLLTGVQQVALGQAHSCAVTDQHEAHCWGSNVYGQLGDNSGMDRFSPELITNFSNVDELAAGVTHTCARRMDGSVWCWGSNEFGQLAHAPLSADPALNRSLAPIPVPLDVVELAAGDEFSCALTRAGALVCWGRNQSAQLGSSAGSRPFSAMPFNVPLTCP